MARRLLTLRQVNDFRAKALPFIAFCIVAAFVSLAEGEQLEAWWLRTTFVPTETSYQSLSVTAIDPHWGKISILGYGSLPSEAQADIGWMRRGGFTFQVDNYFKRKGLTDRALCGVFEDRARHRGRFLLVLERIKSGPWRVAFLHQEVGEAGFSVLVRKGTGLFWGPCMQCGEFSRVRLKQGGFYLEPAP